MPFMIFAFIIAIFVGLWEQNHKAEAQGVNAQGVVCTRDLVYDASNSGATLLLAGGSISRIYICGFDFMAAVATNVQLVSGTTTTTPCDTNQVVLTPAFQFSANGGLVDPYHLAGFASVPPGVNLCIKTNAGNAVQALVHVAQL